MNKLLVWGLALLLGTANAFAGTNGQGVSVNGSIGTGGQLIGSTNNAAANAGNVGEYISANVATPGSSISSNTATDVTSISLTPGDWDVRGNICYLPANSTSTTALLGWVSLTSATLPTFPNGGAVVDFVAPFTVGNGVANQCYTVGTRQIIISTTTTVYLDVYATLAVSTATVYGFIGARRMR